MARIRPRLHQVPGECRYRARRRRSRCPACSAPAALLSAENGYGGRYGIVWDRRTGMLTPTLRVVPASTWLADRADADGWVANWGGWLASLGYMPMLRVGDGDHRHRARAGLHPR